MTFSALRPPLALSFVLFAVLAHGANAAENLADWRFSREIRLDTTPSGAAVAGDVANYPLAVRLTAEQLDFAQANPAGADVRFSDAAGTALPHSVEQWDAAAGAALVWVRIPLIRGNAADQLIHMHWGNPAAADASDSTAVFAAADGFVGVWHLADEGNANADNYKDATASVAHGTGVNTTAASRAAAALGPGLDLRYADRQWVKIDGEKRKLFDLTDRVTFSAWALARSFSNRGDESRRALPGYETIFAKGDNSWRLQKFGVRDWHNPPADLCEICVERAPRADLCVVGKTDMVTDQWYHFVGVHDHPEVRLYVNGALETVETFNDPWISGDHPVGIGNQSQFPEQGRNWDGLIDECRVMNVVKDDHWIKLDYESQRADGRLLAFGEIQSRP